MLQGMQKELEFIQSRHVMLNNYMALKFNQEIMQSNKYFISTAFDQVVSQLLNYRIELNPSLNNIHIAKTQAFDHLLQKKSTFT